MVLPIVSDFVYQHRYIHCVFYYHQPSKKLEQKFYRKGDLIFRHLCMDEVLLFTQRSWMFRFFGLVDGRCNKYELFFSFFLPAWGLFVSASLLFSKSGWEAFLH